MLNCQFTPNETGTYRHLVIIFYLKCVVFLAEVAKDNNNGCGNNFGNGWIKIKLLYKQFYEDIIEQNIGGYNYQVTE